MNNYLIRVIGERASVIGLACVTTGLVNRACRIHGTSPAASAALGRALTGAALMGNLMKAGQRIGLKFEGNGPLGKILAEAEYTGAVRGFVGNPGADAPLREGSSMFPESWEKKAFSRFSRTPGPTNPTRGS
jgi:molecular chaperone Hsp33